jgi:hypothetical protein
LGTKCLTVNVSNFLAMLFHSTAHAGPSEPDDPRYTFPVAYWNVKVSMSYPSIHIRRNLCMTAHNFLSCLPVRIRHNLRIATHNSLSYLPIHIHCNLRIVMHSSLNCSPVSIRHNLRIAMRSSLSYPPIGIRRNLRITMCSSLSYPPAGIRHTLLLKSNNMPLLGKIISANAWVLQKGLLFLFIH